MSPLTPKQLRDMACQCLTNLPGEPEEEMQRVVSDGTTEVVIIARPQGASQPMVSQVPHPAYAHLLGPFELQIVQFLLDSGPCKSSALAKHLGSTDASGQANPKLRYALAGLVERNILCVTDDGYVINPDFFSLAKTLVSHAQSRIDS